MATVIKRFRDKETKKVFEKGSKFEGNYERVKELQKLGYLEEEEANSGDSDPRLEGNVESVKSLTAGLGVDEFKTLLELEKSGKNRKSVIEYFEAMIEVVEGEGE